jgi:hypothetical protein
VFAPSAKDLIKRLLLQHPNIDVDGIRQTLMAQDISISRVTVAGIRQAFRDDLRFLAARGLLRQYRPALTSTLPTRVTPRFRRDLSSQCQSILAALRRAATPMGPNAIADRCSMQGNAVRYLLHHMTRDKQIERVGHGRYRARK